MIDLTKGGTLDKTSTKPQLKTSKTSTRGMCDYRGPEVEGLLGDLCSHCSRFPVPVSSF